MQNPTGEYQRKISRHHDMSHSNLILHKNENSQYLYFEINMPYLILMKMSIHFGRKFLHVYGAVQERL